MKTFIIAKSEYMLEEQDMFKVRAKNLVSCLEKEEVFWSKEEGQSDDQFLEDCRDANGDGMPFITILESKSGKKVFG